VRTFDLLLCPVFAAPDLLRLKTCNGCQQVCSKLNALRLVTAQSPIQFEVRGPPRFSVKNRICTISQVDKLVIDWSYLTIEVPCITCEDIARQTIVGETAGIRPQLNLRWLLPDVRLHKGKRVADACVLQKTTRLLATQWRFAKRPSVFVGAITLSISVLFVTALPGSCESFAGWLGSIDSVTRT
jgi:hypothetical protein